MTDERTSESSSWHDALSAHRRGADADVLAAALVDEMSVAERCSMLDGASPFWAGLTDLGSGGYHRRPFQACVVERLGIPGFSFVDGPRGAVIGPATAFPVPIARGATFDPQLEERVGDVIGAEVAAVGATLFGGVCINLLRHLAWGRAQETYGEDPFHLGVMGSAAVRGVQRHVMATAKHFALNSMENARFTVDVTVDLSTLYEVYLPHFAAVIDEGVACVMSAYNAVNGEWCGQSHLLLDRALRQTLGFEGFVISDWIFGVRDGATSLEAGLDVEMPYRMVRHDAIVEGLEHGTVPLDLVDRACRRILRTLLRFHVERPTTNPSILANVSHRSLARDVATRSFVLVSNECEGAPILPLTPGTSLAVLGPLGSRPNLGDGGSSDVYAPDVVTFAEGLRRHFTVVTDDGDDGATVSALAARADVAVVVVGSTRDNEGEYIGPVNSSDLRALLPGPDDPLLVERFERYRNSVDWPPVSGYGDRAMGSDVGGDRTTLSLSAGDRARVSAAVSANARTVVVVMGATATLLCEELHAAAAVLFVFYPGLEGGTALADVLRGASEPAGRLPFALPHRVEDLVDFDPDATAITYGPLHGQWHLDDTGVAPALPFGFGLGWGPVTPVSATVEHGLVVATVLNDGPRDTNSVIFAFVRLPDGERPWRLAGFSRVDVPAGQSRPTTLTLDLSVLHRYDREGCRVETPPGPVTVEVGRWARDPLAIKLEFEAG